MIIINEMGREGMINKRNKLCMGHVLLVSSVLIVAGFSYWLAAKSEEEKAHDFYVEYKRLILKDQIQQARKFHNNILSAGGDAPLSEAWLPLVQAQEDGYDKLANYVRMLAGNTEREASYEEIADLIRRSPQSFQGELKNQYLIALNAISQVRSDLLQKHGLIVE